jgi:hypothetical protein
MNRSILTGLAAIAAALTLAAPARAIDNGTVAIDFTDLGTQTVSGIYQVDWLQINAYDSNNNPLSLQFTQNPVPGTAKGLGIVGGLSDLYIDGDEFLAINLADGVLASSVLYYVGDGTSGDGDGLLGECTVYAWGACDHYLGLANVSGEETINVSALFGNQLLNRVVIRPRDNDALHIYDLSVTPAGVETIIDFETMGTMQTAGIFQDGFEITCSDTTGNPGTLSVIPVVNNVPGGLGVVGGPADLNLDTGESIRVDFGGAIPVRCFYQVLITCDGDFDGRKGEHRVTGWGPNGHILGQLNTWGETLFDVNAAISGLPLQFYSILGRDTDCLRVRRMSYLSPMGAAPTPGDCKADINNDGQTDIFDFAEFADDFGCGTGE